MKQLSRTETAKRKKRAKEWVAFRVDYLYSQTALGAALGISRRTVQNVEAGSRAPLAVTLAKFEALKKKVGVK